MRWCTRPAIAPARPAAAATSSRPATAVSEMLDYVPASFRVLRHIRPQLVCKGCDTNHRGDAVAADRARHARPGAARPCAGRQILRSPAALSPVGDLCPRRRRPRPFDHGRLGRQGQRALLAPLVAALARPCAVPANGCTPTTRRCRCWSRGRGKTKTGRLWTYVRDDRPYADKTPPAVCYLLQPGPQGRSSACAPQGLPRRPARRWLCRLQASFTRPRSRARLRDPGGRLLGPCPAQVLRPDHAARRRSPKRRCGGSASSTISRGPSAADRPSERLAVRQAHARPRFEACEDGWTRPCPKLPRKSRHRGGHPLCPGALAGAHPLSSTTAASRSTTTPPSARSGRLPSGARTGCSPAPTTAASAPRHLLPDRDRQAQRHRSRSLSPHVLTKSPTTRSTASTSSCPGSLKAAPKLRDRTLTFEMRPVQ